MAQLRVQFVSRGTSIAAPEDEQLVGLIPPDEAIPFRALVSALADAYFNESAAWVWAGAGEGCWPMAHFYFEIARREIQRAISTGVLQLTTSVIERPASTGWFVRLLSAVSAVAGRRVRARTPQTAPPR